MSTWKDIIKVISVNKLFDEKDLDKFNIILDVEGYIMPKNKTQKVKIFINGVFNKELIFSENERRNKFLTIEISNINQDFVEIEFQSINPKSPFDLLESVDTRRKAIKIHSLTLDKE